jgi:hypothetical protein
MKKKEEYVQGQGTPEKEARCLAYCQRPIEEFPTQPATLVNWPPLYIVPTMTLIHKSKYIFGILDLLLTGFLHF